MLALDTRLTFGSPSHPPDRAVLQQLPTQGHAADADQAHDAQDHHEAPSPEAALQAVFGSVAG
jgi:hypothetical protein